MTLAEALSRARSVPAVGDYEFCRLIDGDGMWHMLIVVESRASEVTYMQRCGTTTVLDLARWEVAGPDDTCTCLRCVL